MKRLSAPDAVRSLWAGFAVLALAASGAAAATGEQCRPAENGPPFCLLGTETAPGLRLALVQEPGVFGLTRLSTGSVIDAWKVEEVGRGWIGLARNGQTQRLSIGAGLGAAADDAPAPPRPKLHQHGWAERGDTE